MNFSHLSDTKDCGGAEGREMSIHRTHRIDRNAAEQLFLRGPIGSSCVPQPLWTVLAAAAAPGHDRELAGEQAALAAFREARLTPAAEPRRTSMIQHALAKLLTVKIAAVTIAATTTLGGVALAASTGTLPNPIKSDTPTAQSERSPATGESAGSRGEAAPSKSPKDERDAKSSAAPSPSMVGLCRAYNAHPMDSRGKALESTAFTALVTAAGGKASVNEYCLKTLAAVSTSAKPHPTGKPATAPTTAPSQAPNAHPTGKPSEPGKAPASVPPTPGGGNDD
jgi:hypothetical protein